MLKVSNNISPPPRQHFNDFFAGNNPQQGQENRNPLPNPWSPGSDSSATNPSSTENTQNPTANAGAAAGGMFGNPMMQNLMQQIMRNPQTMQSMLNAPYTQSLLQAMAADPEVASSVIGTNPMFASNPELQVSISDRNFSSLEFFYNIPAISVSNERHAAYFRSTITKSGNSKRRHQSKRFISFTTDSTRFRTTKDIRTRFCEQVRIP